MTTFHGVKSERMEINGGIPQAELQKSCVYAGTTREEGS